MPTEAPLGKGDLATAQSQLHLIYEGAERGST
jgi:hypothetical protein